MTIYIKFLINPKAALLLGCAIPALAPFLLALLAALTVKLLPYILLTLAAIAIAGVVRYLLKRLFTAPRS